MSGEFYGGIAHGSLNADGSNAFISVANDTQTSILLGGRFGVGSLMFGIEGDTALNAAAYTGKVSRLRLLLWHQVGNVRLFGAAGFANAAAQYCCSGSPGGGPTAGFGAEVPVSDNVAIRLEVLRDWLAIVTYSGAWTNTAVRAGAIVHF